MSRGGAPIQPRAPCLRRFPTLWQWMGTQLSTQPYSHHLTFASAFISDTVDTPPFRSMVATTAKSAWESLIKRTQTKANEGERFHGDFCFLMRKLTISCKNTVARGRIFIFFTWRRTVLRKLLALTMSSFSAILFLSEVLKYLLSKVLSDGVRPEGLVGNGPIPVPFHWNLR